MEAFKFKITRSLIHSFKERKKHKTNKKTSSLSHLHLFTANNNNYNYRNVIHSDLM